MKKYKFLLKPAFYIFSLFFATWLVFKIERIKPSDFGRYKHLFGERPKFIKSKLDKKNLKKLCIDYKAGVIDSLELERKIDKILSPAE
jgi:hypothetical protein